MINCCHFPVLLIAKHQATVLEELYQKTSLILLHDSVFFCCRAVLYNSYHSAGPLT